jgi:hypothetical protein
VEARPKKPARRGRMTQEEIMNLVTEQGGIVQALKVPVPTVRHETGSGVSRALLHFYGSVGLTADSCHPRAVVGRSCWEAPDSRATSSEGAVELRIPGRSLALHDGRRHDAKGLTR